MRAGHRLGVLHGRVVVQQVAQLAAQPVPVGVELPRDERLDAPRPEPEVHAFGRGTGRGAQGVGVEAELEHVPGLGLGAGELGIERLVGACALGRVVDLDQEVGDAPHAVVHEGHLVDDVVAVVPRGAHPGDPLVEALARVAWRHLVDAPSFGAVVRQTLGLVLGPLVGEEPGEAPEPGELGRQEARIEAVPQREVVAAVEPGGDLRGGEEAVSHGRPPGPIAPRAPGEVARNRPCPSAKTPLAAQGSEWMECLFLCRVSTCRSPLFSQSLRQELENGLNPPRAWWRRVSWPP